MEAWATPETAEAKAGTEAEVQAEVEAVVPLARIRFPSFLLMWTSCVGRQRLRLVPDGAARSPYVRRYSPWPQSCWPPRAETLAR